MDLCVNNRHVSYFIFSRYPIDNIFDSFHEQALPVQSQLSLVEINFAAAPSKYHFAGLI